MGWGEDGHRVAAGDDGVEEAQADHGEQAEDEEVGGGEDGDACVADPAHVDQGEQDEDTQADGEDVRVERRHSGDECTDAGRDADCGGEHVVDHERGCCEQACAVAEVFGGDGVGAAAVGVGLDGLAVGEVDDDQKDDDRGADLDDVVDAAEAERDEQGERGFRAVGGGGERVEAEDGDAG